jgi:hypothetical protein
MMSTEHAPTSRNASLSRMQEKRNEVVKFIHATDRRSRRLTNIAIICGAVAAALTAGPALGGKSANAWLSEVFGTELPAWQLLCFGAMVCSVAATIATNLSKSHEVSSKLMLAQTCNAKLEGLQSQTELKSWPRAAKGKSSETQALTGISNQKCFEMAVNSGV